MKITTALFSHDADFKCKGTGAKSTILFTTKWLSQHWRPLELQFPNCQAPASSVYQSFNVIMLGRTIYKRKRTLSEFYFVAALSRMKHRSLKAQINASKSNWNETAWAKHEQTLPVNPAATIDNAKPGEEQEEAYRSRRRRIVCGTRKKPDLTWPEDMVWKAKH